MSLIGEHRILIVGNSGSGKSFAARKLAAATRLECHSLDSIFWKPGGCSEKRPPAEVHARLDEIRKTPEWIIEGAFGDLIERCVPDATHFVFLDLDWEACERNLRARGFEPEKWAEPEIGRSKFEGLVSWASEYRTRTDRFSHSFHARLFEAFPGTKLKIESTAEIDAWLKSFEQGF